MNDLLSRCKLFNKLATAQALADAFAVIQGMEPEDAEYVVRCGKCIFWDRDRISCEGLAKCLTGESGIRYRYSDDFCSKGRKRMVNRHDGRHQ